MLSVRISHLRKPLRFLFIVLGAAGLLTEVRAEAVSDVMVGYSASWRAGMGGTDQVNAAIYSQFAGAAWISRESGTPQRMNVVGTKESAHDPTNEINCGEMIGWINSYNARIRDVVDAGNALGADQFAYIGDMADNGAAAQAEQPGRSACYEAQWWWQVLVAHESGGHNFGCAHEGGRTNPTTVMMHNYCSGGAWGLFSSSNIWLGGTQLVGGMSGCTVVGGADNAYQISTSAQGRADMAEQRVWGSWIGAPKHRWQFNLPAAAAPAGTTITDSVSGAVATVRGQGATFTGTGLRLPGGATGNTAANSIAAYLDLPNGLFSSMPNFTIEIWATPLSAKNGMRVIDIGRTTEAGDGLGATGEYTGTPGSAAPGTTSSYDAITLSAAVDTDLNTQRFEAKLGGTGVVTADSNLATTAGEPHHYAITFADTPTGGIVKWFRDGVLVKTLNVGFHSASLNDVNNWLGRSLRSADDMSHIDYHDIRIQSAAIADGEVAGNYRIGRHDAKVTLWANDAAGASSWMSGSWEFGQTTPNSNYDYEVGTMRARTPWTTTNSTFPGRSISVTGGSLFLAGKNAKTATVNDLRLNNAYVISSGDSGSTQTLAGNITVPSGTSSQIRGANGQMILSANISGSGTLTYTENAVTLTANNAGFTGTTIIGDGRTSTLQIGSEENLGPNPASYRSGWLQFNRGILETTATMTIDDANRGVLIGTSGGTFKPSAGTTLTIASTLNSPEAGDTLQTAPMYPYMVVGRLTKDGSGTLALTNQNNSYIGEMVLTQGELRLDGAGRLNNGDMHMPITLNSTLNVNTTSDQIFSGVVSGNGTFLKNNRGTTALTASNTFTGSVAVNGGTLLARATNAAINGNFSYVSGITVNNGGTLRSQSNALFGSDGTQTKPITLNYGGIFTTDAENTDVNVGTITLNGGNLTGFPSPALGSWNFKRVANAKIFVTENSTVSAPNIGLGTGNSIEVASGKTLNFTGTITDLSSEGVSALVKTGTGTLLMAGPSTYTGPTTVSAGTLAFATSQSAIGSVTTSNGAGLRVQAPLTSAPVLTSTSLTLGALSPLTFDLAGLSASSLLIATGTFTASGAVAASVVNAAALPPGTYKLVSYTSFAGGGTFSGAPFAIGSRGATGTLVNNGTNGLYLTVTGGDNPLWTGLDNGNWQTASTGSNKNWRLLSAGTATDYLQGDNVLFNDDATGPTAVAINSASVTPAATTFNNSTKNYTVTSTGGFGIGGGGTLTKNGSGSLTLSTANSFTGYVIINGGTLFINPGNAPTNRAFSYVNSITINNGGTLRTSTNGLFGWDATQAKPITVNAGGTLATENGVDANVGLITLNGGTLAGFANSNGWGSWNFGRGVERKLLVTDDSIVTATEVGFHNGTTVEVASGKNLAFTGTITNNNDGVTDVIKTGPGTVTLSGVNTYTGPTSVFDGILSISANHHLGADGTPVMLSGGTLQTTSTNAFSNTRVFTIGGQGGTLNIAGNGPATTGQGARFNFGGANTLLGSAPLTVTGSGMLNGAAPNTQTAGTGALILGASQSYNGNVTARNGGMLEYAVANALGANATVTLGNEGEFAISNGLNIGHTITVNGGTNSTLSFANANGTVSGTVNLNADLTVGLRDWSNYGSVRSGTISGNINGSGGLIVNSGTGTGGTLTLTNSNGFTGPVTVTGAILYANTGNGPYNRALSYTSGITVNNGGILRSCANGLFGWEATQTRPITVNSGGIMTNDAANSDVIVGNVTLNGGTLAGFSGTAWGSWNFKRVNGAKLSVTEDSTVSALNVGLGTGNSIEVAAGKTCNFTGSITDLTSEGACALVKTGDGTLTLAGTYTYTGTTSVNGGTLRMTATLPAASAVTVAAGATIIGTGTVNGSLAIQASGNHSPGNLAGVQTVNGALSYAANSRLTWNLVSNSSISTAYSRVAAGSVTVTAGAIVDLVLNGGSSMVNFTNSFWSQSRTWTLMSASNKSGNFTLGTISADADGRSASNYGTFALQQTTTAVRVTFTPYPPNERWRRANFGEDWNNTAVSGDLADPDNDGIDNLLERAFGGNPNSAEADILPYPDDSSPLLSIIYRKSISATDLVFTIQESADLVSPWTTAAGTGTLLDEQDGVQRIRFTAPAAGAPMKMLRVLVTKP